jgi:hypothetical protein
MKGIDFIRDRDAMAADLGEFEMSCTTQVYRFGMILEVEIEFTHYPSTFGNCDSYDLNEIWVLGHYPEGDQSDAFRRSDYVPLLVKVKIEDLTEADVKEINYACAAHVARCIKEARGY